MLLLSSSFVVGPGLVFCWRPGTTSGGDPQCLREQRRCFSCCGVGERSGWLICCSYSPHAVSPMYTQSQPPQGWEVYCGLTSFLLWCLRSSCLKTQNKTQRIIIPHSQLTEHLETLVGHIIKIVMSCVCIKKYAHTFTQIPTHDTHRHIYAPGFPDFKGLV